MMRSIAQEEGKLGNEMYGEGPGRCGLSIWC